MEVQAGRGQPIYQKVIIFKQSKSLLMIDVYLFIDQ